VLRAVIGTPPTGRRPWREGARTRFAASAAMPARAPQRTTAGTRRHAHASRRAACDRDSARC